MTTKARELQPFWPWYKLLVGGYAQTFDQLGQVLVGQSTYASRSGADVGIGSCEMSRYDALPLTMRLLDPVRDRIGTIVDLGCGSGKTLADLIEEVPDVAAVGVDPETDNIQAAKTTMAERALEPQVTLQVGDAQDAAELSIKSGPACFATAFVLQEVLEQHGRQAVVDMIRNVFRRHPDSYWVVVEVDNRIDDRAAMTHQLAHSYYNPYFLVHYLTEQRLESAQFWNDVFAESGATILAQHTTDQRVDSTGFELGYLLRATDGGTDQ